VEVRHAPFIRAFMVQCSAALTALRGGGHRVPGDRDDFQLRAGRPTRERPRAPHGIGLALLLYFVSALAVSVWG